MEKLGTINTLFTPFQKEFGKIIFIFEINILKLEIYVYI